MQWGMALNKEDPRVFITPITAKKVIDAGHQVHIEKEAGAKAGFPDDAYEAIGVKTHKKLPYKDLDVLLTISTPDESTLKELKNNTYVMGLLKPHNNTNELKTWAKTKARFLSLELVPRITRAQSMDVLSSQSNLAGYKAVITAAEHFGRCLPLMMTAAGTVPAAHVLIIGAGVAGLQAIATAKRLGAVVHAFDVRPAAKEQVESLGAKFVSVESDETGDGSGGYAKEMSKQYQKAQAEKLLKTLSKIDIVITTAQIPGKPAPKIITKDMVEAMKPGGVIVDLASESGGNCELTEHGKTTDHNGVSVIAPYNILSSVAYDASQLLARNVWQFAQTVIGESGELNMDDEITQATLLTDQGKVVHPNFKASEKD